MFTCGPLLYYLFAAILSTMNMCFSRIYTYHGHQPAGTVMNLCVKQMGVPTSDHFTDALCNALHTSGCGRQLKYTMIPMQHRSSETLHTSGCREKKSTRSIGAAMSFTHQGDEQLK
jgi:hypothetical protein